MKHYNMFSSVILGSVALCLVCGHAAAAEKTAASAEKPFRFYVSTGASYDDNLLRLRSASDADGLLANRGLSDWYRFLGAGFESLIARENQRFELLADVRHQTYEEFDEFNHTSGRFRGAWHIKASEATRGKVGYRFRRELRSFVNQNTPIYDIIEENAIFAEIEQQLAQRWLLRLGGEATDLNFSASPLLEKQRSGFEAELRYAASQQSTFGLLTTYTQSKFDENSDQDFSGWSIGPLVHWRPQPNLTVTANVGYTHQGLDDSRPDIDDFDGATGFVAAKLDLSDSLSVKLRAFRDISDLGGDIPLYTIRSGARFEPTWQITRKLATRAELEYQRRDFTASSVFGAADREDDYFVGELWFDFSVAPRWLVSLGVGKENRDSNVDLRNFDDVLAHATIRFNL